MILGEFLDRVLIICLSDIPVRPIETVPRRSLLRSSISETGGHL